jgi:hypothetical protein
LQDLFASAAHTGREVLHEMPGGFRIKAKGLPALHVADGLALPVPRGGLEDTVPKKLTLPDPETLIQLAERGGYNAGLEGRHALEHAIETGRGGVWLALTEAQYRKLKRDGDDRKL